MHILITDSGVGGLSVCAYAERFVRTHGWSEPVRLTFANAAPANDYGYNAMPSRQVKLDTFDRFLASVVARYRPDVVYVACNTLSVLLPDTPYTRHATMPVKGILETAIEAVMHELAASAKSAAMIFATPTTIEAGVYESSLAARGIAAARIVSQACPGLADTISEDRNGARAKQQIARWVGAAIDKLPHASAPVVACLACTHYGYRKALFAEAFAAAGIDATVVDPNERAVDEMFATQQSSSSHRQADVELVTKYALPAETVAALTHFLEDISPRTVAAVQSFVYDAELF